MPTVTREGASLYYGADGEGEAVAFLPEAGLGAWSWGWQHAAVAGPYQAIVADLRGTGRSDRPPGPYDLGTLVADLEAVLVDCGVRRCHAVGAGLGGAIALAAARHSGRIRTLTLFGTPARGEAADLEALFAPPGEPAALRRSLEAGLSASFRERQPEVVEGIVDWRAEGDADREGWESQVAALEGFDATDWGYELEQPALVVHGTADELVPVDAGRELAEALPRGRFEPLDGAGHLCFVERSRTVNDLLVGFLESAGEG